jgi:hypothetical protein
MTFKKNAIRNLVLAASALAAAGASATTASAADRRMTIINETNHTLVRLLASNTGDSRYHGDWLGRSMIYPGQSYTIDFNDGTGACMFDFAAQFSDRQVLQDRYVNVCRQSYIRFTGN